MICVLPGNNARIFARAIQTIAKFGDLYFEPECDGLSLKSINSSKSAYITFKFFDNFFSDYDFKKLNSDTFDGKCKVSIKTFLSIFKNMKQVDQCKISIDSDNEKLIIEFNCKLDTRKKFCVSIMDIEVLQPGNMGNLDNRNKISGTTKIFSDISNNFQMAEEEITIVAEQNRLLVKNYIDGQVIDPKFMRSQLKLKGEEFDVYSVKNESSITYCLREFRALLHFAESANIDFSMFFEDAGMPVVFKTANLSIYEATLFMSTLSPDDISMIDNGNENNSHTRNISINEINNDKSNINEKNTIEIAKPKQLSDTICVDDDDEDITNAALMEIDVETESERHLSQQLNQNSKNITLNGDVRNREMSRTSHFPLPVTLNINDEDSLTFLDSDIQDDCIPLSPQPPPTKRMRSLFQRCFEPTYLPSDSDTILAIDSDSET